MNFPIIRRHVAGIYLELWLFCEETWLFCQILYIITSSARFMEFTMKTWLMIFVVRNIDFVRNIYKITVIRSAFLDWRWIDSWSNNGFQIKCSKSEKFISVNFRTMYFNMHSLVQHNQHKKRRKETEFPEACVFILQIDRIKPGFSNLS